MSIYLSRLLKRLPDRLYIVAQNARFYREQSNVRYIKYGNLIRVNHEGLNWVTHRERAHVYRWGLSHRGNAIGHSYLLQNIEFDIGDCIVDCGANMGDLALFFYFRKAEISYIGIEPNPLDFRCLSQNLLSDSKSLNIALWNQNTTIEFFVDSKGASSSVIEPPRYSEIVNVQATRLDSLKFDKIKLLKVEGEGAEPEILEGARSILRKIEYISVDWGPERGLLQTSTRDACLKFLLENSFALIEENDGGRKTALFKNNNLKV